MLLIEIWKPETCHFVCGTTVIDLGVNCVTRGPAASPAPLTKVHATRMHPVRGFEPAEMTLAVLAIYSLAKTTLSPVLHSFASNHLFSSIRLLVLVGYR